AAAIAEIGRSDQLAMPSLDELRAAGTVIDLGEALHDDYLAAVVALRASPSIDGRGLAIAYTPLHGVGARSVEPALRLAGFPAVHSEPSQREPDPEFPTVAFPNPEEKGAMDRVLALAVRVSADVVLANDPDADRLCVAVPDGAGYRVLTGDQTGAVLA